MQTKKQQLSRFVGNDEPLARYIFSSSHFSAEKGRIKRQAFMPPKSKNTVSVIRHKGCPSDCVLKIGQNIGQNMEGSRRRLKAVGSLSANEALSANNLKVEPDTSQRQHRRHANIIFQNYTDAKIRQIAQRLAQKAVILNIPPRANSAPPRRDF